MRKTAIGPLAGLLVWCSVCAYAASVPLVQKMLPGTGSVKGFSVYKDSLQYGKGDDISKIYNGGYEFYIKSGVVDAARQMYKRGGDYVEVTVHTMKSEKAAGDFLAYWQKQHKVSKPTKTKTTVSFIATSPNVMGYSATGKYFTTVSALHTGQSAKTDVGNFLKAVEKKVLELTKKGK